MAGFEETLDAAEGGVLVRVKIVPGASRTRVAGLLGDRLKLQVAAPPEAGKANRAVCALFAKVVGLPKTNVRIVAGHTQPRKTVAMDGVTLEQVRSALEASP